MRPMDMVWQRAALLLLMACSGSGSETRTSAPETPGPRPQAAGYVPQAKYCVGSPAAGSPLCPVIPGNIGPDPSLDHTVAYNGIVGAHPTSAANDVQSPFDNLSWETFVALNWTLGKERQSAKDGLQATGRRVWEGWPRVADVFGNGPVRAQCNVPPGLAVFQIASNGKGQPVAQNEEYIQAATGDPAIDVSGNWTIYERRLNDVEIAYLKAPQGKVSWNLTTAAGQRQLVKDGGTVSFPSLGIPGPQTGAIEIKAAWRVLDPAQRSKNQQSYYLVPAMLTVAPDLVTQPPGKAPAPICAQVDLGLVAMHIIQKNPDTQNALKPEWFWSTFEHVDNAPLATQACDLTSPADCPLLGQLACPVPANVGGYTYFNRACPDCQTNQPPTPSESGTQFAWNPIQPFAKGYLTTTKSGGQTVTVGTQISRCWKIYSLTDDLNTQWRGQLRLVGSVFQNYMLVGTQWGASITSTPDPKVPTDGVPSFLSNTVVETYLQTLSDPQNPFATGSCVSCHRSATLAVDSTPSNLSFLPGLVTPGLVRRAPMHAQAH
jgi:hypothetical protein